MKAFLSRIHKRNAAQGRHVTTPERAMLALTEARMVLSESEPLTEGWGFLPFPTAHPFEARDGSGRILDGGFGGFDIVQDYPNVTQAARTALAACLRAFALYPLDGPEWLAFVQRQEAAGETVDLAAWVR